MFHPAHNTFAKPCIGLKHVCSEYVMIKLLAEKMAVHDLIDVSYLYLTVASILCKSVKRRIELGLRPS